MGEVSRRDDWNLGDDRPGCPESARSSTLAAHGIGAADLEMLRTELAREDLQAYVVVRLAARDMVNGDVDGAIARLRVDSDKLRPHETPITNLLARLS